MVALPDSFFRSSIWLQMNGQTTRPRGIWMLSTFQATAVCKWSWREILRNSLSSAQSLAEEISWLVYQLYVLLSQSKACPYFGLKMLTLANLESLAELHNRSLLGTSQSSNRRRRGGLSLRHRSISKDLKFGQAKDTSPFVPKGKK